jgi:hypothetical protein
MEVTTWPIVRGVLAGGRVGGSRMGQKEDIDINTHGTGEPCKCPRTAIFYICLVGFYFTLKYNYE